MKLLLIFSLFVSQAAFAAEDLLKDFDSLGGNDGLVEQAGALTADKKVSIVQNRIVDRMGRHEFSGSYSYFLGGDAYVDSQSANVAYNYHFNPHWSLGASYSYNFNTLTDEAEDLISEKAIVPEVDWVKQSYFLNLTWYPIYGKFNVYDMGVVHFDFYPTIGYGEVELKSGKSASYTAGLGMAFWISQHLVSRAEFRYMNYTAQRFSGDDTINSTMATVSMGYLL